MLRAAAAGSGYDFLAGIGAWSEGVVARRGHHIVRAVLRQPVAYPAALDLISRHLDEVGRPVTALCAIELRIPQPLSLAAFETFNASYFADLKDRGLITDGLNPVARTNVAMVGVSEPALHAFAYTVADDVGRGTFVVAGTAELRDNSLRPESIVRRGEVTADALRDKAVHVVGSVTDRMRRLGVGWADTTDVFLYTVHPIDHIVREAISPALGTAVTTGITWYPSRPPFEGIEVEVDVRGVATRLLLDP